MIVADISAGESVFIDANVFVYDFAPDPIFGPSSRRLLERIEEGDVNGFTSSHVLSGVAHRLMTLEACHAFGWPFSGIVRRLSTHPDEVRQLRGFRRTLDSVIAMGVQVVPVTVEHVLRAAELSENHGILSGDALVVAVMQACGLVHLASSDVDFDRVPGIIRYGPDG